MDNFFYTVVPELKEKLERIKTVHDAIALIVLAPKNEIKAQWEASINRITHSLIVNGIHSTKNAVLKNLRPAKIKKVTEEQTYIFGYKSAYDSIKRDWYASEKRLTEEILRNFAKFFIKPDLSLPREKVERMLNFVQIQTEHPVVQASLSHALIQIYRPFSGANEHLATILPYVFLYKHGLNFRNMMDLEEYRIENKQTYDDCLKTMKQSNNLSGIIEFYTNAIISQSEKIQSVLLEKKFDTEQSESFFHITDRQKQILALFDEPGLRLTNRKVQEIFDVSQITASRDLAKLAELNLLFSSGRGRSVFYTKI